jgi:sarcosine oxidase, subunit gamma
LILKERGKMHEPIAQSPLHGFGLAAQATHMDASKGVWVNEISDMAYVSLRGDSSNATFLEAVSKGLGCALPLEPCRFVEAPSVTMLWLSPDEWMLVCPRSELQERLQGLKQSLADIRHQVVDNSGGYTQLVLRGKNAADVLGHVTVYDLQTLTVGRVVGTTLGKTSVYLRRQDAAFTVLLRRSFADYIWRYLVRAAEPYGLGIARPDRDSA